MSRGRVGASFITVLLLCTPGVARAQDDPGVHVDPGSPAGKEYAVPLAQARRQAASGSSSSGLSAQGGNSAAQQTGSSQQAPGDDSSSKDKTSGSSSSDPPLFGEGVTPVSETKHGKAAAAALAAQAAGSSESDDSSVLGSPWVLGLGVILLGLAAGLLVRKLRSSRSA